jgi:hypothetical protein
MELPKRREYLPLSMLYSSSRRNVEEAADARV